MVGEDWNLEWQTDSGGGRVGCGSEAGGEKAKNRQLVCRSQSTKTTRQHQLFDLNSFHQTPWKYVFDVTSVGQRSSIWPCNSVSVECELHFPLAQISFYSQPGLRDHSGLKRYLCGGDITVVFRHQPSLSDCDETLLSKLDSLKNLTEPVRLLSVEGWGELSIQSTLSKSNSLGTYKRIYCPTLRHLCVSLW